MRKQKSAPADAGRLADELVYVFPFGPAGPVTCSTQDLHARAQRGAAPAATVLRTYIPDVASVCPPAREAGRQEAARTAFERSLAPGLRPSAVPRLLLRRERAAHAHRSGWRECDLGDLVKRDRPKIAKNLMTLSIER